MASLTLGVEPIRLSVLLVPRATFWCTLRSTDGDWPYGSKVTLYIDDRPFDAVLDGAIASWKIDAATVAELIATNPSECSLFLTTQDGEVIPWAQGQVRVRD